MSANFDVWRLLAGLGNNFDRAMDMKEIMDTEKAKAQANPK